MNILVCNDDGINAEGIKTLAKAMKEIGNVTVCAPSIQHSGAGHSITCDNKIKITKTRFDKDIDGYAVDGTPRDCVEFAMRYFEKGYFDIIVSGINRGDNLANNIACSGTCGAACAGLDFGVPAIAFSLAFGKTMNFDDYISIIQKQVKWFSCQSFKNDFVLNVNIPNIPVSEIKGEAVCGHGGSYKFEVVGFEYPEENVIIYDSNVVSMTVEESDGSLNSDTYALAHGYVTLSPISLKMIQENYLDTLKIALKKQ